MTIAYNPATQRSLRSLLVCLQAYLVGASGGCYALISAHLAIVIINWKEMPFNWVRLLAFLILIGGDIASFVIYTMNDEKSNVSILTLVLKLLKPKWQPGPDR